MVGVRTFYFHDPSLNQAKAYSFFVKCCCLKTPLPPLCVKWCLEKNENKQNVFIHRPRLILYCLTGSPREKRTCAHIIGLCLLFQSSFFLLKYSMRHFVSGSLKAVQVELKYDYWKQYFDHCDQSWQNFVTSAKFKSLWEFVQS